MESHDPRWAVERAEHDRDSPVLVGVRDGFDTAAGEIEVRNPPGTEYPKAAQSFRRHVHVPIGRERCRARY